ncbi:MAG: hypothetical protein KAS12_01210 [Candidatus Aenigmarchaeota archaeon]|nr:hypothetical protein [Candidatus Aenigmarchaeota archaeon]
MYKIYRNIYKLLASRKCTILNPILEERDFFKTIDANGVIIIDAKRQNDELVKVALFKDDSRYLGSLQDFRKFIKVIQKPIPESIIIFRPPITDGPSKYKNNAWTGSYLKHFDENIYVEAFDYRKIIANFPEHVFWVEQEIASKVKIEEFLELTKKDITSLESIYVDDTAVVWLGARPGDVIRVLRPSEASGMAIAYRLVKASKAFV